VVDILVLKTEVEGSVYICFFIFLGEAKEKQEKVKQRTRSPFRQDPIQEIWSVDRQIGWAGEFGVTCGRFL
jgi:hypothetical protein